MTAYGAAMTQTTQTSLKRLLVYSIVFMAGAGFGGIVAHQENTYTEARGMSAAYMDDIRNAESTADPMTTRVLLTMTVDDRDIPTKSFRSKDDCNSVGERLSRDEPSHITWRCQTILSQFP